MKGEFSNAESLNLFEVCPNVLLPRLGQGLEGPKAQMSWRLKAAEEEAKLFQAELPPILAPPHPRVRVRHYVSYMLRPDLISDQAGINSRVYALLDLEGREIHCSANLPWCPKRP